MGSKAKYTLLKRSSMLKSKQKSDPEKGQTDEEVGTKPVPFCTLFRYADKKEKCLSLCGFLAAILSGICVPAMVTSFGQVTQELIYHKINETSSANFTSFDDFINETYIQEELEDLNVRDISNGFRTFIIAMLVIGSLQLVLSYLFVMCFNSAAESQIHRMRGKLLLNLLRQEIGWFDTHQINEFASRFAEDLNKLRDGLGEKVGMVIYFSSIFIASLINAFMNGWKLTLVILTAVPILIVSTGLLAKVQSSLTTAELKEYAKAGGVAEEVFSSIRTVLAFGGEDKEVQRYEKNLIFARTAGVKRGIMTGVSMGTSWFIVYSSFSLAFWYGTKLTLDSRPPFGDGEYLPKHLLVIFFSILMGAINIGQASPFIEAISIARGAAASIFESIERKSALDPTSKSGKKLENLRGNIEFHNVHFSYPSRKEVNILRGINFCIQPGQTIALAGSSGCGKSTCVQLIQRFYDPSQGSIRLDGVDIRDLNLGWLRDEIGIVGQEPVLFATTIEENIRFGREDASFEDIQRSAKEANAHDFIMSLPLNYQTQVGDRGVQMSGGQKQRIAIARALVKNPKILLLDEATSALDILSESVVQRALDKARIGRTTIIVAHRLTTIRSADIILTLEDGVVSESGTHEELMEKDGLYKKLVKSQLSSLDLQDSDLSPSIMEDEKESGFNTTSDNNVGNSEDEAPSKNMTNGIVNSNCSQKITEPKKDGSDQIKPIKIQEILKWNAPEACYIIFGVIGASVQGVLPPCYAIVFGKVLMSLSITDEVEAREKANGHSLMFFIIAIIAAVSMFFQAYMFTLSGENLTMRLRKGAFKKMLQQEMGWFDAEENSAGSLCSRLSEDASAVQGATGTRIGTIMQSLATITSALVVTMFFSWKLALVGALFVIPLIIALYFQSKILMGQSLIEKKALDKAGKIAVEALTNIRTVASLHKEEVLAGRYSKLLHGPHKKALHTSHIRGFVFGIALALPCYAYASVFVYAQYLMRNEGLEFYVIFITGEALIFGSYMVGQAIAFAPNFTKAKLAASRLNELLKSESAKSRNSGTMKIDRINKLTFTDVHFSYPTRSAIPVLNGLSLEVNQGETVALVGNSGCGKSTIFNLLERFYDIERGNIDIDSNSIQTLDVNHNRRLFGLVAQEPVLFDRSLAENIAYGDNTREIPKAELEDAAKQANIHDFILTLPQGYETRVGEKGSQLSGGQKQRIAIARALLRNPNILLLDEATSALDSESEKIVQETLERVQEGRTSIVIAHRLSTIRHADKIIVIEGGKVVEFGNHDQLINKRGSYFRLHQSSVRN